MTTDTEKRLNKLVQDIHENHSKAMERASEAYIKDLEDCPIESKRLYREAYFYETEAYCLCARLNAHFLNSGYDGTEKILGRSAFTLGGKCGEVEG